MSNIKDSKLTRTLIVSFLAIALAITMTPLFARSAQAAPIPQDINVHTGTYYYDEESDRFIIGDLSVGIPFRMDYEEMHPDINVIENLEGYAAAFWNQQGATPIWRVATASHYVDVQDIIDVGALAYGIDWNSGDYDLGFTTTDEPSGYTRYVSSFETVTGDTSTGLPILYMGLNTESDSATYGGNSTTLPYLDVALKAGTDYPRGVVTFDSTSTTIESDHWAGDYRTLVNPAGTLRYLEGAEFGASPTAPLETWGRRFPAYLEGIILLTEIDPPIYPAAQ